MSIATRPLEHRTMARTPASFLDRLQTLSRAQRWVKGAVNYDEDLHFSTYYLRASLATHTLPLYEGYTSLVASYDGFNETYWLLEDECRSCAQALLERALRQPRWLPRILAEIRKRSDALADIFPAGTSPATLARLSDARLLKLYQRHDASNRALYKVARLPEALDRGVSTFTGYLMSHLRSRGVAATECAEVFAVLSEPEVPSVLAQEIVAFDEIVRFVRENPATLPATADGAGRARMHLDPELFRRLDAHRETWQFLSYHGYGRREVASLDQYVSRLLEQAKNPRALADCAGLLERCARAGRARADLLKSLNVDAAHAALLSAYPEIGAAKLHRRSAQLRNFYFLDMLLVEIARRLGVSEWTVRVMIPEEIMDSIRERRLCDEAIRARTAGSVLAVLEGEERVLTGEEAKLARGLFHEPTHRGANAHGNVLTGAIACRGKITAPCKIVIRADDCRAGFPSGAILVSESTDPDLVRFLRAAGGVLTEQGGVTSHAAIICRELGIPTIIGIDGLLERVRDGDILEVDADQGTVRLPERAPAPETAPAKLSALGAKARNLALVRSHGFRVPEFVTIDHKELRAAAAKPGAHACKKIADRALAALELADGEMLAVRSSALAEDREDGSGAGDFESLLDVHPDSLGTALRTFVTGNRRGKSGATYRGSVIVQRMIRADIAGVCLTRDGRTGSGDAVIVEMVAGGNTGVTGGTVRPDRFVVDRMTGDILEDVRRCEALRGRAIDVTGLVRQFLTLEARMGGPLDIEWALVGGDLFILQARAIVGTRGAQTRDGAGKPDPRPRRAARDD